MARTVLIALSAVALACACASAQAVTPVRTYPRASQLAITPVPRSAATPAFVPGPSSLGGVLGAIGDHTLTLATIEEGEVVVDLTKLRDVWRETSVAASKLEVGDDLFINGYRTGSGFVALYVYANIGRIDGVIRAIDGDSVEIAPLRPGAPIVRLVVSLHLRSDSLTLADVRPGETVGAVVYRPRDGVRRITKMWR